MGRRSNFQGYRFAEGAADIGSDVPGNFAGCVSSSVLMVPTVCCGDGWEGGEYLGKASSGKSLVLEVGVALTL